MAVQHQEAMATSQTGSLRNQPDGGQQPEGDRASLGSTLSSQDETSLKKSTTGIIFLRSLKPRPLLLPKPPDGGYGWFIVMASFLSNFVMGGVNLSFGLFLEPLVKSFGTDYKKISLIRSIMSMSLMGCMTITSALINKFGAQAVYTIGVVLSSVAFIVLPHTNQINLVFFACAISGLGLSGCILASLLLTNMYFEKRRAIACGLVISGSAVGQSGQSLIITWLIKSYSWETASTVSGFLILSLLLVAPLMRDIKLVATEDDYDPLSESNSEEKSLEGNSVCKNGQGPLAASCSSVDELRERTGESFQRNLMDLAPFYDDVTAGRRNSSVAPTSHLHGRHLRTSSRRSSLPLVFRQEDHGHLIPEGAVSTNARRPSMAVVMQQRRVSYSLNQGTILGGAATQYSLRPLARRDSLFEGDITKLASKMNMRNRSEAKGRDVPTNHKFGAPQDEALAMEAYRATVVATADFSTGMSRNPRTNSVGEPMTDELQGAVLASHLKMDKAEGILMPGGKGVLPQEPEVKSGHKPFWNALQALLDFKLLCLPSFLLTCMGRLIVELGLFVPFTFMPSLMHYKDIGVAEASYCMMALGIGNLVGRLSTGFIIGIPCINSSHFSNLATGLAGVTMCLMPLCRSFLSLVGIAIVFGLTSATYVVALTLVLTDMYGIQSLTSAMGLLGLFRSVGLFGGPLVVGVLFDHTGNYLYSFLFSGLAIILGCIVSTVSYLVRTREVRSAGTEVARINKEPGI